MLDADAGNALLAQTIWTALRGFGVERGRMSVFGDHVTTLTGAPDSDTRTNTQGSPTRVTTRDRGWPQRPSDRANDGATSIRRTSRSTAAHGADLDDIAVAVIPVQAVAGRAVVS